MVATNETEDCEDCKGSAKFGPRISQRQQRMRSSFNLRLVSRYRFGFNVQTFNSGSTLLCHLTCNPTQARWLCRGYWTTSRSFRHPDPPSSAYPAPPSWPHPPVGTGVGAASRGRVSAYLRRNGVGVIRHRRVFMIASFGKDLQGPKGPERGDD